MIWYQRNSTLFYQQLVKLIADREFCWKQISVYPARRFNSSSHFENDVINQLPRLPRLSWRGGIGDQQLTDVITDGDHMLPNVAIGSLR